MFADKLIDKPNLLMIPHGLKVPPDKKIQEVISLIPEALRFRIDNVYDYCREFQVGEKIRWEDFTHVRVAHKYTWYEWEEMTQGIQVGVLVDSRLSETREETLDNLATAFVELVGGQVFLMGVVAWENDFDGMILGEIKSNVIPGSENEWDMLHNLVDNILPTILSAVMFINCKNVVTIEQQASKKEQKRRQRKNQPPIMSYKTIEIKPMTKALRDEGNIHQNGMKQALHICRGHFKDYRETGLFGKHKGLYWWDTHVRGNESAGTVVKDYSVSSLYWIRRGPLYSRCFYVQNLCALLRPS